MMKKMVLILILFSLTTVASATIVQWDVTSGGNGHYYEILDDGTGAMSWETANTLAQSIGGQLASITSAEENQFIIDNLISTDTHHSVYIGGFRADGSGWQWADGELWGPFSYWDPGEPNNENLVFAATEVFSTGALVPPTGGVDTLGGWNDVDATYNHPDFGYIVETVPEPTTLALLTLGGLILRRRRV